ncbi:MAG: hypothetical protein JWM28_2313 [Chitinophagaceae bacterium]|nr:hypothetical protein [Chitinophagaceae bacterium]
MKNIFWTLAAISVFLLGITLFQIYQTNKKSNFSRTISIGDLKGFEDSGPNADAFKELREKINSKITLYKEKEHKAAVWVLIMSFLVTSLTGASTLISTIKAARSPRD